MVLPAVLLGRLRAVLSQVRALVGDVGGPAPTKPAALGAKRWKHNKSSKCGVAHGTYLFTLVAMFLAVCLRQFCTIVILIEAGEARSSSLVSTQSTGLQFVRVNY